MDKGTFPISRHNWKIAQRLTLNELQREEVNLDLIEEDFFKLNIGKRGHNLFLGFYSKQGIELALKKYGIYEALEKKGYKDIKIDMNLSDPYKHCLKLSSPSAGKKQNLAELVVKRDALDIRMPFLSTFDKTKADVLVIEWLLLQNPLKSFPKGRPALPGQMHPGLGLSREILELLVIAVWRLAMKGIVNVPDHYHNAALYSKIFYYENPEDQAKLEAIIRDTKKYPLNVVAWAVEKGKLYQVRQDGRQLPFEWFVSRQILPLNKKWSDIFAAAAYKNQVYKKKKEYKFIIDPDWLKEFK